MDIHVGPSFRTYTVHQAVLIAGLTGTLTFRVSPIRAAVVTSLIAVIALAISGLSWSRTNKVLPLAAYVLGITAELGLSIPVANHHIFIRVAEQLSPLSPPDRFLLAATIIILVGCLGFGLAAFVHSMVKELPQGWRTPLWGEPDQRKVIPLRRAS